MADLVPRIPWKYILIVPACLLVSQAHLLWSQGNAIVTSISWNASSTLIAVGYDGGNQAGAMNVVDATTGAVIQHFSYLGGVSDVAWNPQSDSLVAVAVSSTSTGAISIVDVSSGSEITLIEPIGNVTEIDWSPNGQYLASAIGFSADPSTWRWISVWNAFNWTEDRTIAVGPFDIYALDWSPDGTSLVSEGPESSLLIWDANTGELKTRLVGHSGGAIYDAEWSSDGGEIASITRSPLDATIRVWDISNGHNRLTIHDLGGYDLAWSPDGQYIASAYSNGVSIWDAATGVLIQELSGQLQASGVAWSPNGSQIVVGGTSSEVVIDIAPTPVPSLTLVPTSTFTPTPTVTPTLTPTAIPTATPTPTPTLTPTPPPTLTLTPAFQRLRLTSLCSANPAAYRLWRIRNSNPYDVVFTWDVYRSPTGQNGFGVAPPAVNGVASEVIISTVTESGPNTMRLFVDGAQQDVKASSGAPCPTPTPAP